MNYSSDQYCLLILMRCNKATPLIVKSGGKKLARRKGRARGRSGSPAPPPPGTPTYILLVVVLTTTRSFHDDILVI